MPPTETARAAPKRRYPGPPPPVHPSTFKGLGRLKFKALFGGGGNGGNGGSSSGAAVAASAVSYAVGAAVWVSDPLSAFVAGHVVALTASGIAVSLAGTHKTVDVVLPGGGGQGAGAGGALVVLPREALPNGGVANMDELGAPHAAAVLDNVDTR
jgi:hypothetical protein